MNSVARLHAALLCFLFSVGFLVHFLVLAVTVLLCHVQCDVFVCEGSFTAPFDAALQALALTACACVQVTTGGNTTIVITGQKTCVDAAKLLIDTQLKYARDLQSARSRESAVVDRLKKLDLDYGDRPAVS